MRGTEERTDSRRFKRSLEEVMHPYRIAILILFLGATVANYSWFLTRYTEAAKGRYEHVWPAGPGNPIRSRGRDARAASTRWMYELMIVTIAGVAWILVRQREK
jgi:hypothetical protein